MDVIRIVVVTVACMWSMAFTGPLGTAQTPVVDDGELVAKQFRRQTIYHSRQSPGYTCWAGAWIMPDKSLMVSFIQAPGPMEGRPRASKEIQDATKGLRKRASATWRIR